MVDDQPQHRWLRKAGLWEHRRKSPVKRRRRACRTCMGVMVRRALGGTVTVHWCDRDVTWQQVPARPQGPANKPNLAERVAEHAGPFKPAADHPWRASQVYEGKRRLAP